MIKSKTILKLFRKKVKRGRRLWSLNRLPMGQLSTFFMGMLRLKMIKKLRKKRNERKLCKKRGKG